MPECQADKDAFLARLQAQVATRRQNDDFNETVDKLLAVMTSEKAHDGNRHVLAAQMISELEHFECGDGDPCVNTLKQALLADCGILKACIEKAARGSGAKTTQ